MKLIAERYQNILMFKPEDNNRSRLEICEFHCIAFYSDKLRFFYQDVFPNVTDVLSKAVEKYRVFHKITWTGERTMLPINLYIVFSCDTVNVYKST